MVRSRVFRAEVVRLRGCRVGRRIQAEDPPVHVRHVQLVVLAAVAVERQAEQPHVGVLGGVDDRRAHELAILVIGEHPLIVRVLVPREEVAGARRDIDPVAIDRDPEWVARVGRAREDRDITECAMTRIGGQDAAAWAED